MDDPKIARPALEKAYVVVMTLGCFPSSLKSKPIWMALSCNVSKVLKVVGDDGSKEVPSKNINFYLCASRSHHSLRWKLGSSRARSLPPLPIFENIPSLLLGNVVVNKDFGFQEWKLLSKAEIFIERKN